MDAFADPAALPESDSDVARPTGPDLTVRVTGEASGVIAAELAAGRSPDAEAVVAEALALLQEEREAEPWKEARFAQLIQESLDDYAAGRFETIAAEDLGAWMDDLGQEARGR